MTKTIIVGAVKGGVGKTTIATNQACLLAKSGKKTLLIDLDPQGHVLLYFGLDPRAYKAKSLLDYVKNQKNSWTQYLVNKVNLKHLDPTALANLDILPTTFDLKYFIEETKSASNVIFNAINKIIKSNAHDYVVIDTNPNWDNLIVQLFVSADAWITPFTPTAGSQTALADLIDAFKQVKKQSNKKLKLFIVPNALNIRKRKDKETGQSKVVETISYQIYSLAVNQAKGIVDAFVCPVMSKSDQYDNAVSGLRQPVVTITDKTLKQFKKPKKQQIELNEFIINKI